MCFYTFFFFFCWFSKQFPFSTLSYSTLELQGLLLPPPARTGISGVYHHAWPKWCRQDITHSSTLPNELHLLPWFTLLWFEKPYEN